jgi:hypothetical protein
MTNSIENPISFAVTYLRMSFGEQELSSGSGFFWKHSGQPFLITNWHNVSGRNPETDQPLSPTAAIPDSITFSVFQKTGDLAPDEYTSIVPAALNVRLYGQFDNAPVWLEHPVHGKAVDVVAIPLLGLDEAQLLVNYANECVPDLAIVPRVSQDAFVVGYPLGLLSDTQIPIWKRATIATEPGMDIENLPKLLIDTATRSGMSGSLVLAKHLILGGYKTANGEESNTLIAIKNTILGVYSGRLGADEIKAQLGIVWKRQVIDEILAR